MYRKWWNIFSGGYTEVRILSQYATFSGYFKSYDNLISQLRKLGNVEGAQVYFVLNQIDDACYGRAQCEILARKPKQTTTDHDIVRRKWVLIDFDPVRPAGVNSTAEELAKAHEKAVEVYKELKAHGFMEPVVAMSGNGYHLLYRIDMPNDTASAQLVQTFLTTLAMKFGDGSVDVDEKVFNAGRICKLYGTMARKGANNPDRPWRKSEIIRVPENIAVTDKDLFASYISRNKVNMEPVNRSFNGNHERFTLEGFLSKHGIRVHKEIRTPTRTTYRLEECPFDSSHKNGDAALFESSDGKVGFHCFHNSCSGKTWQDVRELFEPGYKDRSDRYRDRPPLPGRYVQRDEPKPKEENEDDGRKWLPFSDIKSINLDKMPKIETGFKELDKQIKGFYLGEFVLLSGSNSAGKSSWINTLLLNLVDQGVKCALWSGELPAPLLKTWIKQVAADDYLTKVDNPGEEPKYYVNETTGQRIDAWVGDKLVIYNANYGSGWEQVFNDMSLLLPQGVKFFVLDNLMSLDIESLDETKNEAQKKVVLALKDFATKNGVVVMLVAHPRKVTTFLRKEDISGSSDITNVPDDVFIIHRVNMDFYRRGVDYFPFQVNQIVNEQGQPKYDTTNVLEICKNRIYGVMDYLIGFEYRKNSRRFVSCGIDWNRIPVEDYGFDKSGLVKCVTEAPAPNINIYTPEARDIPFAQQDDTEELPF